MKKVNVLMLSRSRLYENFLADIASVDPQISVKDGTEYFVAELLASGKKDPSLEYFIQDAGVGKTFKLNPISDNLDNLLKQAEVIYGVLKFPENLVERAPRLKWIHIAGVGLDRYLATGIFNGKIIVSNNAGVVAVPIAEHIMAFILALAKDVPRMLTDKAKKFWDQYPTMELYGKTVGIIGLGAVGSALTKVAKSFGMTVIATEKSAMKRSVNIWGVDEIYPDFELNAMLNKSDFVVIAAPLTSETKRMITAKELHLMRPNSYLINIARGQIVNQDDLVMALKEGWIAGAALDVYENEPLPSDSELWNLKNVILSFHIAGFTDKFGHRTIRLFCENLKRYVNGEQLLNVIDVRKEY